MSYILGLILIEISGTGLMSFSIGAFVLLIEDALHFKRSAFFLINSLTILFSSLTLPLFRRMLTRLSPSKTVLISSSFISLNYLGFSFLKAYPLFLFLGILNGLFINGISSPLIISILRNRFKNKEARLFSLILSLSTLFSSLFLNILREVNDSFSYRWGYRLISLLSIVFSFLGAYLIRGTGLSQNKSKKGKALLKDKSLLLFSLILFWGNFANLALFNNIIPYASEISFSSRVSHSFSSLTLVLVILWRLFIGKAFERGNPKKVVFFLTLSPLFSFLLFTLSFYRRELILPSLIFTSLNACFNALPSQALSRLYKNKEGDALTFLLFSSSLGSSLGSLSAAAFYDIGRSYLPFWEIMSLFSLAFICLSYRLWQNPHDGPVVSA